MTPVRGIELVYLYVSDVARSIAFYENGLGLAFTRYGNDWAECTLPDGVRFGFHLAHDGARPQPPGSVIVDLRVGDLAAASARLAAAGARVDEPQEAPTGRFVTFLDPDGHRVQVFQQTRT